MNLFQEMEVNYKDFIESANDFMNSCRDFTNNEDEKIFLQFGEITEKKRCKDKIKAKIEELESDIQQKNFEIKCLNSDIKNMYCKEGVIAILEDNFDLSREEAIQILEEE